MKLLLRFLSFEIFVKKSQKSKFVLKKYDDDKLFNNIDEIEEYLKLKSTLKQKSINAYFNK